MILPDKPIIKILLFSAIGVFGPLLAMRERMRLPVDTCYGIKWRKIKLVEAIAEALLGASGVLVFSLEFANIPMPGASKIWLGIVAFMLLLCIGIIKDAFIKAERKEQGTDSESS